MYAYIIYIRIYFCIYVYIYYLRKFIFMDICIIIILYTQMHTYHGVLYYRPLHRDNWGLIL